jgi:hypothetical protein
MMRNKYHWIVGFFALFMGYCSVSFSESLLVDARSGGVEISLPEVDDPSQCSIQPVGDQPKRVAFDKGAGFGSVHFDVPPYYDIVKNKACDVPGKPGHSQYTAQLSIFSPPYDQVATLTLRYDLVYDQNLPPQSRQVLEMNYSCTLQPFDKRASVHVGSNSLEYPLACDCPSCKDPSSEWYGYNPKLSADVVKSLPPEFLTTTYVDRLMFYAYAFVISIQSSAAGN